METIDWSNNSTLEFIQLLQTESVIWDFKNKNHKNKIAVHEAWERIQNSISVPCTLEDLKRKRNSLMTSYRAHLKKIIDTANTDNVYKPTWFAFEPMHRYLGSVYTCQNSEELNESNVKMSLSSRECGNHLLPKDNTQLQIPSNFKKCNENIMLARKQEESEESHVTQLSYINERSNSNTNEADENYLFCQILGQKLKKMEEDDRLIVKNEINNLVFKHEISVRSKSRKLSKSTSTTSRFSATVPYFESQIAVVPTSTDVPRAIKYEAP